MKPSLNQQSSRSIQQSLALENESEISGASQA
jgi:hypothetical protein